ncbi:MULTISPECIES: aminotransferase class IV [Gammaproteobacteria]|uniref:aminotransferase class IV n=1 Tax=Gammaproteobacteria TaxID=1236 RepID=UPI000DCF737B|nr:MULTISPECIES: aminotransferase class IV [Gammaproteobacteria]RTE87460.1 D-amino acid aminotransferase [Aliidiomarina sp. B3213]TCZ92755.1 D-amino acid aminotransferase [Lysobacter sp. N42]
MSLVYLNGEWLRPDQAVVSVFDRGFLFADGIYEVVPFYQGHPLLIDHHLERLERSLEAIDIPNPLSNDEWVSVLQTLAEQVPEANAIVYIQVTRGAEYPRAHLPSEDIEPTFMATASHWTPPTTTPPPVNVELLEDIRWHRCDIKSISLLGNIHLKREAHRKGGFEPILHRAGRITEGASCNYFIVKDEVIYTPPADELILAGITREWIIQLAHELGLELKEEAFSVEDLMQADECFLSSSTREVQPVGTVGEQLIADGKTGRITDQLAQAFRNSRPVSVEESTDEN